ncbi:hypothetical protein COU36_01305 [Candidatus Micrarchaeota archaeon CG10_big_fil_rev_8_21_14_0_10_59_7]|nr:MAG: hypothetical protein COU36_01305 [Candidatus Micrarchaeota archaeon CG10_big_fil_rev_8_21_14_0_10_59_7]
MRKEIETIALKWTGVLLLVLAVILFASVLRSSLFGSVPEEKHIWFELSFLLLLAVLAELLVVYLRQPTVMVLLLVGIAMSPSALALVYPLLASVMPFLPASIPQLVPTEGVVQVFAQLGAIILLFKIGLHSEVKHIFNSRNFVVALLGIVVPFAAGYYYAVWTGSSFVYALFLGAALTATSVGVTVAVLSEFGVLGKGFAKVILGAAVIDDILALLVLSLVKNVPASLDAASLAPFAYIIATAAIFVAGGIKLGQYVVRRYFDPSLKEGATEVPKTMFLGILAYVMAYAYVAEFIGLSAIVGAFIAGITLNYSRLTERLFALFYPLEALFVPVFFITLGMLVNIPALWGNLLPILAITALAMASKFIACGGAALATGVPAKDAAVVGVGMSPRGEIALIIGLYGLTAGVLGETEYSIIASMAFLTTIGAPWLLKKAMNR